MGAVRKRAVFWVAVLKRDPHTPVKDAIHFRSERRGILTYFGKLFALVSIIIKQNGGVRDRQEPF
jgi:hypothetical protein